MTALKLKGPFFNPELRLNMGLAIMYHMVLGKKECVNVFAYMMPCDRMAFHPGCFLAL